MHYYNREIAPITEGKLFSRQDGTGTEQLQSPYEGNTQEFKGNIVSKQFRDNMIKNLGADTICITQGTSSARRPSSGLKAISENDDEDLDLKASLNCGPTSGEGEGPLKKDKNKQPKLTTFSTLVKRDVNPEGRRPGKINIHRKKKLQQSTPNQ